MKDWYVKFMVLTMTSGVLFQLGGCVGDLLLRLVGVLFLDQFVGPLIGDPAGDILGTGGQ